MLRITKSTKKLLITIKYDCFLCRLEANQFKMAEHSGTHMDAPSHFSEGGLRIHDIPLEDLVGPGVIVNVKVSFFLGQRCSLFLIHSSRVWWNKGYRALSKGEWYPPCT